MKKIAITAAAGILSLAMGAAAFAADFSKGNQGNGAETQKTETEETLAANSAAVVCPFLDEDQDGICDNCGSSGRHKHSCNSGHHNSCGTLTRKNAGCRHFAANGFTHHR